MSTQLIVTREHVSEGLLPVRHLSYSAIRSFLQSENLFFKKYVRCEFDEIGHPSMMIGKAAHDTTEKFWQDKLQHPENATNPDAYVLYALQSFTDMIKEQRDKTAEAMGGKPYKDKETGIVTWADKDGLVIDYPSIEEKAIKWSKTVDEAKAREQLETAVRNYIANADDSETISTEIMETVEFTDLEGEPMPLPLKGIIDRIETHKIHGKGLRDYKFVASFSDPEERNPGYELQASAFYFVYQGITGKSPEYAMFEEVLKKEPGLILPEDPTRKLLQADLKELCDKNEIPYEKFSKNVELQDKLTTAGVLVRQSSVQRIVYKFAERKYMIEAFLEIYKRILNRLGLISLYSVPYGELVNPFDQMNGAEAWEDFTGGLAYGEDTMKRPEKAQEVEEEEEVEW